jgi:hypothetical protein
MAKKDKSRRKEQHEPQRPRAATMAVVLALSGAFLTATTYTGYVCVTNGGPASCVQFKVSAQGS